MKRQPAGPRWGRLFFVREERTRTTWTFRIGLIVVALAALWMTRTSWSTALARSLVCEQDLSRSEALLLENFDPAYEVFDRAASLRASGVAGRVLVPIETNRAGSANLLGLRVAELMADVTRLGAIEPVVIPGIEPISLNAAYGIREFLLRAHVRSVTVVTPLFRSRRSALVYRAALDPAGIAVRCVPVSGARNAKDWTGTWHGIQDVVEQWSKLQYYRVYVLPFAVRRSVQ